MDFTKAGGWLRLVIDTTGGRAAVKSVAVSLGAGGTDASLLPFLPRCRRPPASSLCHCNVRSASLPAPAVVSGFGYLALTCIFCPPSLPTKQVKGSNSDWQPLSNSWGATWEMPSAPQPPLSFKVGLHHSAVLMRF